MMIASISLKRSAVKAKLTALRWGFQLGILLLIICATATYLTNRTTVIQTNKAEIEQRIHAIEGEYNTFKALWLDSVRKYSPEYMWAKMPVLGHANRYGTGIFLFEGDSLVFWNRSPTSSFEDILHIDTTFQFSYIGSKISVPRCASLGTRKIVMLINLAFYYPNTDLITSDATHNLFDETRLRILPYSTLGSNIYSSNGNLLFAVMPRLENRSQNVFDYLGWVGFLIVCFSITLLGAQRASTHNVELMVAGTTLSLVLLRLASLYFNLPDQTIGLFDKFSTINIQLNAGRDGYLNVGNILIDSLLLLMFANMILRVRNKIIVSVKRANFFRRLLCYTCVFVTHVFIAISMMYTISNFVYGYYNDLTISEIYSFNFSLAMALAIISIQLNAFIILNCAFKLILGKKPKLIIPPLSFIAMCVLLYVIDDYTYDLSDIMVGYSALIMVTCFIAPYISNRAYRFLLTFITAIIITFLIFFDNFSSQNSRQQDLAISISSTDQYANNTLYSYMLQDNEDIINNASAYSYLKIVGDKITEYNGEYAYSKSFISTQDESSVYDYSKEFKHFVYSSPDKTTSAVVSRQIIHLSDLFSIFMSVLLLLIVAQAIIFELSVLLPPRRIFGSSLYSRVQMSLVSVVIITVIVIQFAVVNFFVNNIATEQTTKLFNSSYYINTDYRQNLEPLSLEDAKKIMQNWASNSETKFQANINIYNQQGYLIVSSSSVGMQNHIVPRTININVMREVSNGKSDLMLKEKAGSLDYVSMFTKHKHACGNYVYLNISFFTPKHKPSTTPLIANIINIFLFVLVVAIIMAMLLYKQILRPLTLIKDSIRDIKYRRRIDNSRYHKSSEVDALIDQYNNTIAELEASYIELANREREGAWKTLAQQVAHEIKNPLTPIKLKVQMLQRKKQKNDPYWIKDVDDTLSSISSQIDLVADIVSQFSNFAKMDIKPLLKMDIAEILQETLYMYRGYINIKVSYTNDTDCSTMALTDSNNFRSVITNLMLNAVYAIGEKEDGTIDVRIYNDDTWLFIDISDNGMGITPEDQKMIFKPNFTNKKTGSGIGLTLSLQIVKTMGGTISFESEYTRGTTFSIKVPSLKDNN